MIDDPSTGERFDHHTGICDYIERFFIGYHTVTRLLSLEAIGENRLRARVDFTGDFGHGIGPLDIAFNEEGLISRIDGITIPESCSALDMRFSQFRHRICRMASDL